MYQRQYPCKKLVFHEETGDVRTAIEREKQLKRWRRAKKIDLINTMNPSFKDLYEDLFGAEEA